MMWNNDKLDITNAGKDVFEKAGDLFEKGHGMVDTISEYLPYVKVVNGLINKRIELKCKQFLQGLAIKLFSSEDLTSDDLQKLNELIMKDKNMDLILNILEEATNTVSYVSSKILGVIAGQVMEGQREFNYNDWTLVNGLKNMNDWDINNFKKFYMHFNTYPNDARVSTLVLIQKSKSMEENELMEKLESEEQGYYAYDEISKTEEYKMLKSSLMRMSSFQIISEGPMAFAKDGVTFEKTQVSDELYKLIKKIE